jgi:NAD(P)-dependent dehydrogenase (short-subunit alcohol dehydrogenase family)
MWVNGAAVMAYGTTDCVPTEIERAVIETNLMGTIDGCRAALRLFRHQGDGVIVNVASLYAAMASPFVSSYVTSKFAVLGYSDVLRQDLAGEPDIADCVILPGSMDTPIFRHAANYTGRAVRPIPPVGDPAPGRPGHRVLPRPAGSAPRDRRHAAVLRPGQRAPTRRLRPTGASGDA